MVDFSVDRQLVRRELASLLQSDRLRRSPSLAAFLRFIVERTLAGDEATIKERTIAVEALGRDRDFDPRIDPIVRVLARKLRRALEAHDAAAGIDRPLRIVIPKGTYVPRFERSGPEGGTPSTVVGEPIPLARVRPPSPPPDLVRPEAWCALRADAEGCRVIAVVAPGGFGKSTFVADWIADRGAACAWVSLDADSARLHGFLRYLQRALAEAAPEAAQRLRSLLDAPAVPAQADLAAESLAIARAGLAAVTLVLDDYHVVADEAIHAWVVDLFGQTPPGGRCIIASRSDVPVVAAAPIAQGGVHRIGTNGLRFDLAATDRFLRREIADLDRRSVAEAARRLDGWPAALRIFRSEVVFRGDVRGALESCSASGGDVAAYIDRCLLDALPDEDRSALVRLSVLDEFHHAHCAELCGARCAQRVTAWFDRAVLLVVRWDQGERWYRFHHLVQRRLRALLQEAVRPDERMAIHRTASRMLTREGAFERAVDQALAAGDIALAIGVIRTSRSVLLNADCCHRIEACLQRLPAALTDADPEALLARGWVAWWRMQAEVLVGILRCLEACDLDAGQVGEVQGLQALLSYWTGDADGTVALATASLAALPAGADYQRSEVEIILALGQQAQGHAHAALRDLDRRLARHSGPPDLLVARRVAGKAFVDLLDGRLAAGEANVQTMERLASSLDLGYTWLYSRMVLGNIAFQRGAWDDAVEALGDIVAARRRFEPRLAADALAGCAVAHQFAQRPTDSAAVLDELERFAAVASDAACRVIARLARARCLLLRGEQPDPIPPADRRLDGPAFAMLEPSAFTACRVALVTGELRAALAGIDEALQVLERQHNGFQLVTGRVLKVAALAALGERHGAREGLVGVLVSLPDSGWLCPFLEQRAHIEDLLSALRGDPRCRSRAAGLASRLASEGAGRRQQRPGFTVNGFG